MTSYYQYFADGLMLGIAVYLTIWGSCYAFKIARRAFTAGSGIND